MYSPDQTIILDLTFFNYEFGKGQKAFYPMKLSRFGEKIKFVRNTKISYGGTPKNWVKRLSTNQKIKKSNIILEGSRHPKFINPFEYGQSLIG